MTAVLVADNRPVSSYDDSQWPSSRVVDYCMRGDLQVVGAHLNLHHALSLMEEANVDLLSVSDRGSLAGVVSTAEILRRGNILGRTDPER